MKKVTETKDFVIYDDVLDENQFKNVWNSIQSDEYVFPHVSSWTKVWRLTDGSPIGTRDYGLLEKPYKNYMDLMFLLITEAAKKHSEIILPWNNMALRSYLYPRDTKLNWHNDQGYKGAAIFYAHPYWGSTWGGELMIAQTPETDHVSPPHLDHRMEDAFLNQYGIGTYINSKPNRLVLTRPGVWHSINRVDKDAGDNCRATVVAFFKD